MNKIVILLILLFIGCTHKSNERKYGSSINLFDQVMNCNLNSQLKSKKDRIRCAKNYKSTVKFIGILTNMSKGNIKDNTTLFIIDLSKVSQGVPERYLSCFINHQNAKLFSKDRGKKVQVIGSVYNVNRKEDKHTWSDSINLDNCQISVL